MQDWRDAWHDALYAEHGFFMRGESPAQHFRTSPMVGPEFAMALVELLDRVDHGLGRPATLDFVDLGAGGGELAETVFELVNRQLTRRIQITAVEVAPAPARSSVSWQIGLPEHIHGLLVAHEWLDAVPCPVVARDNHRINRVCVDKTGRESLGAEVSKAERAWLERWWPLNRNGERAEVGIPRDLAWADAVARVHGAALAIDYGHLRADRLSGTYAQGTLTGYQWGRQVAPIPDSSCDLTAHVAFDSCAIAAKNAFSSVLTNQRSALDQLGVSGISVSPQLANSDPMNWLANTAAAGRIGELRDLHGLGSFGWLLQSTTGHAATELLPEVAMLAPLSGVQA